MTNKTVQIRGYGFGPSDATTTVTLDGNTIFTGAVPTTNQPVPSLPDTGLLGESVVLFSFEVPVDFQGTKPMTCQVTNGTIVFADIFSNYYPMYNPVFSAEELAILESNNTNAQQAYNVYAPHATYPFTQEETDILVNDATSLATQRSIRAPHGVTVYVSSGPNNFSSVQSWDPRVDVFIDGVEQPPNSEGQMWWIVGNGSTLSYNLNLRSGLE